MIATRELPIGERFDFIESYFWGAVVFDATATIGSEDLRIKVDIELNGCKPWQTTIPLSGLPVEDGVRIVDLGAIEIEC